MRTVIGVAAFLGAAIGLSAAAEPKTAPVELVLVGEGKLARLEVDVRVGGVPVPAIWDETFAKIFTYFDRNADGKLDEKEAALLPAPRALRHAMGNGFTPPVGTAPTLKELDRDGDGKVSPAELATFYRAAGLGTVQVGVGRLPAGAELTAALVKNLDTDGDSRVTEKEWRSAAESLKGLDKNDDELVGAGELVPGLLYPGAAGSVRLTPPGVEPPVELLAKLPLVLLPVDNKDTHWANEVVKRTGRRNAAELEAWRKQAADGRWVVNLDAAVVGPRFSFAGDKVRVDGWAAAGRLNDTLASSRRLISSARTEAPDAPEPKGGRRGGGGLGWLTPIADRDGDGKLDQKEIDGWLDLQTQIARGQVLLSVLDGAGLFELIDRNHDGALSVRELRGAWERVKEAGCIVGGAFDVKKLPRGLLFEISHGYPQAATAGIRRGPDWFQAMDRNGDGDVSRREFTGPADVFGKLDLDKDGLLSPEEAEKADAITPKK